MITTLTFTLPQLLGGFLAVCGGITAVAAAINVIANGIAKAKAPNRMQNERLDKHEEWLKKHDALLDNDNKRLKSLEEGNRVTMRALLARLRHGIDGNDVESMRKAESDLQEYLTDK